MSFPTGGAQSCVSTHVGEIRPGGVRGNHRHHFCNETFIIWGAKTKFRVWLLFLVMCMIVHMYVTSYHC